MYASGSSPNLTVTAQNATHVPLRAKGTTSQSADVLQCADVNDSLLVRVSPSRIFTIYDSFATAHNFRLISARFCVNTAQPLILPPSMVQRRLTAQGWESLSALARLTTRNSPARTI